VSVVRFLPSLIIVKRELITSLRRARMLFLLMALLGAASFVMLQMWPMGNIPGQALAELLYQTFIALSLLMLLGCVLCVPGLAAATIVNERERDTLDQLYLTLVRPSGMIAAKALNTAGLFLLLVIATVPVFAAVMFGVGTDWRQFLYLFVFLAMSALSCAMIGIVCSTIFRRTFLALVAAYVTTTLLMIGGPRYVYRFLLVIATGEPGYLMRNWMPSNIQGNWTTVFSPVETLLSIQMNSAVHFIAAMLIQAVFCLVCFFIAVRLLRRQTQPRVISSEKTIDDPRILQERRTQFPFYLIDPLRRKPLIEERRNPMFVREMRWGLFNRGTVLVRIFYCVFAVSLLGSIFVASEFVTQSNQTITVWYGLQMALLVCLSSVLAANTFAKEYELGNMDMLRMTLLGPEKIVWGKALAGLLSLAPILLAMTISSLPILIMQFQAAAVVGAAIVTLLVCATVSNAVGLLASLLTRSTNRSIVVGLVANAGVFVGLALVIELIAGRETFAASPIFCFMEAFLGRNHQYARWIRTEVAALMFAAFLLAWAALLLRYRRMQDR
jgi:ABC-type transport system involved in multi-copper enzyme maturation permease subunit